jgi:hypothetical protein
MKKIIILLTGAFLVSSSFSQNKRRENEIETSRACGGLEELAKIKGSWKQVDDDLAFPDKTLPKSQYRFVYERIDKMIQLFKDAIPDLSATEPRWYRGIRGYPYNENGPVPYTANTLYFNYYCNNIRNKPELGDETWYWFQIFVNHYNWFCKKVDEWDINNDGKMIVIYKLPPKAGKWKGVTVYEPETIRGHSRAVVIAHNGKLPWHTLTKKQYLTGLKNSIEAKKKNALTPQLKEEYRAKSEKYWDDQLKPVTDYLSSHSEEELKEPAILEKNSTIIGFNGRFGEESNGIKVVAFSTAYWNKDLPRYAPQFMILHWMWSDYIFGNAVRQQFEENFDLGKLRSLIDK